MKTVPASTQKKKAPSTERSHRASATNRSNVNSTATASATPNTNVPVTMHYPPPTANYANGYAQHMPYGGVYSQQAPYGSSYGGRPGQYLHPVAHNQMHAPQVQIQWYQNVVRGPTAEQPTVAAPVPSSNAPPPAFGIDPALLQAPPPTTPQSTSTTSAVAPRPAFGIDPALLLTAPREAPSFPTSTTHLALPGTNPSGEQGEEQRGESQAGVSTPARGSVEPRDGEPPADGPAGPGDKSSAEGATPPEEEASEEGTADMYENLNEPEETVEDFEEDSDGEFVARVDIKGRHVSSLNAKYGKVKGVGRGSRKWVVARTIKMGPVYASQSDSSRAHNAMLRSLISKAEHLSTRTKSWLYIAAQHPSSNLSFIHYASPKLRKNSESLAKLHRTASVVMGGLRDASRKTVTKLATQVREQEGTIKDLEKKIQDYESLLSSKEGDISCLTQAINVVRSHNPDILLSLASSTPKGNAAGM